MANTVYGYVRVSTKDQNEARQMIAMQEFGIDEKHIFLDKQSGKDFNRPQYQKLIRKLKKATPLSSRVSTAWNAIMMKLSNSGGSSPRKKKQPSWCWTCRCWIPSRNAT